MSAQVETQSTAATATIIDSPAGAAVLAGHLLDPERSKPVVVITIAAGQSLPYIDVEEIVSAVRELADVYVLPTGSITFAMSDRLPKQTQVYGGAGRVYPVDRTWQSNPYAAPLRFAFGPAQGSSATDKLIADALGAVNTADLVTKHVGPTVVQAEGYVKALIPPSRAWIRADDGRDAAIWQDLLFPGLPLDRTFRVGMRISGAMDVRARRLDVSAALRKPGEALIDYAVGAVVLCRVVALDDISACVELYPGARTRMSAKEVTGNPEDRLTAVMSLDEVLPARVTARGGHDGRGWHLSTFDVEDSEEILASPSLLPGGPSWLVMAEPVPETSTAPLGMSTAPLRIQPTELTELTEAPKPSRIGADERESLRLEIRKLERLLLRARTLEHAFQFERDGFREQVSESYARVQQLVRSAENARTDLRIEKQKSQRLEKQARSAKGQINRQSNADVLFLDPVEQFRYEVDVAYAQQIPPGDKVIRPRRELGLGPEFLATLSSLGGVDRAKVVDVTVQIITDIVYELDGRELHPLRSGDGPADRVVVREADGARCMRVALQRKSASARRLHYWKVGNAIELSRVVKHDDMTP